MSFDLIDYFDPMDAGYPDRGSIEEQNRYLEKRRARNLLGPAALARLRMVSIEHPKGNGVIYVNDKTVEMIGFPGLKIASVPAHSPKCPKAPLVERVFVVKLKQGKHIEDITDLIGGRIWTLDGVEGGVTVTEIL